MLEFAGISASPGIAIGRVFLFLEDKLAIPRYLIAPSGVEAEQRRFADAPPAQRSAPHRSRSPHRATDCLAQRLRFGRAQEQPPAPAATPPGESSAAVTPSSEPAPTAEPAAAAPAAT